MSEKKKPGKVAMAVVEAWKNGAERQALVDDLDRLTLQLRRVAELAAERAKDLEKIRAERETEVKVIANYHAAYKRMRDREEAMKAENATLRERLKMEPAPDTLVIDVPADEKAKGA